MRVAFDTSFLAVLTDGTSAVRPAPPDVTGTAEDRPAYLLQRLDEDRAEIVIPMPAVAELLTVASRDPSDVLALIDTQARFQLADFDRRAAIECGIMLRSALPKAARGATSRIAVKFDAQILAIAKVAGASILYTDDDRLQSQARLAGITAVGFWSLPVRPADPQGALPLSPEPKTTPRPKAPSKSTRR